MKTIQTLAIILVFGCSPLVIGTQAAPLVQTPKPAVKAAAPKKLSWPAPVEAAFKKAYPHATANAVSKETEDGKVQYEVESMDGTQARDLVYLADGTLVLYEELIPQTAVPSAVMTALKAKYPKATVTRAEKLFQDGKMNYELVLKGSGPGEVVLTPDGKFVSPAK
jgi:hypothetical protein